MSSTSEKTLEQGKENDQRVLAQSETMSFSSCHSESTPSDPMSTARGLFAGAVFNGGHFNININTVNKSPTTVSTTKQRTFKK